MHDQAHANFGRHLKATGVVPTDVLDLGGRTINGNVWDLLSGATLTTLDIVASPEVTIVADARTWTPDRQYGMVISTELLEHVDGWQDVVRTAHAACEPGAWFIGTAASTGRAAHGADGGAVQAGEHYGNVDADELRELLEGLFMDVVVEYHAYPADVAWRARRA